MRSDDTPKEKPDAAEGSAGHTVQRDTDAAPTVSAAPSPVNPARSLLGRILDVATDLACDEGHPGQYVRVDDDVYWQDDRSRDVQWIGSIGDGDLVVLPLARERHEPLELASFLKADAEIQGEALVVKGVVS